MKNCLPRPFHKQTPATPPRRSAAFHAASPSNTRDPPIQPDVAASPKNSPSFNQSIRVFSLFHAHSLSLPFLRSLWLTFPVLSAQHLTINLLMPPRDNIRLKSPAH